MFQCQECGHKMRKPRRTCPSCKGTDIDLATDPDDTERPLTSQFRTNERQLGTVLTLRDDA